MRWCIEPETQSRVPVTESEHARIMAETAVCLGTFSAVKTLWEVRIHKINEELQKEKEFRQRSAGR